MKNILVLIHDDAGQEARLQAAIDVTRALNGHLTCLDVTAVPPIVGDDYGAPGGAMLVELERESEARNRERLQPRLAHEDISSTWVDTTDQVEPALEGAAALADLIVVNAASVDVMQSEIRGIAAPLVVKSGKPLLAVPAEPLGLLAAGSALIAWDGSREASAALGFALPLLRLAERVTLLEVEDGSIDIPAEEAATYLSRHDIHPVIVRKTGTSAADVILDTAGAGSFDYLVMGAYGRSRVAEAIFGGVTRRMLKECPLPIFVAH